MKGKGIQGRVALLLGLLSLTLIHPSCSSQSNQSLNPLSHGSTQDSVNQALWNIRLKSTCPNLNPQECISGYGFSISSDGSYQIGPGPQKEVLKGYIEGNVLEALTQIVLKVTEGSDSAPHSFSCVESVSKESIDDLIAVQFKEKTWKVVKSNQHHYCHDSKIDLNLSKELFELIKSASKHFYPLPFPLGSCETSTTSLLKLYNEVSICTTSQDCIYIDDMFNPISSETLTFLTSNDCSPVKTLMVANQNSVSDRKSELLNSVQNTKDACKHTRAPIDCSGFSTFQPTTHPLLCSDGVCKMATIAPLEPSSLGLFHMK